MASPGDAEPVTFSPFLSWPTILASTHGFSLTFTTSAVTMRHFSSTLAGATGTSRQMSRTAASARAAILACGTGSSATGWQGLRGGM